MKRMSSLLLILLFPIIAKADLPVIDFAALAQLGQELIQLKNQATYLQNALQGLSAGQYQWSNAQNLINQLGQNIQSSNGLAYNAQNLNQQFTQLFPGYQ